MRITKIYILTITLLFSSQAFGALVDFYGHNINFHTSAIQAYHAPSTLTSNNINRAVYLAEQYDFSVVIEEIKAQRDFFDLDDIGTVILTKKMSQSVTKNQNTRNLMLYHILQKLGYDVKLTYTDRVITCFGHLSQSPASSVFIYYNDKKYTDLAFNDAKVLGKRYIYKEASKDTSVRAVLQFTGKAPKVNAKQFNQALSWSFQGNLYHLNAINNQSFTEYLDDLPQFELGPNYLKMDQSQEFKTSVLNPLKKYMESMHSESQKANFLLNFVQNSFGYKTDAEQYGREKYNYPEETVVNSFSDCEDRTLLLAYLYKSLLDLESVILHFEKDKHVCLAVRMPHRSNSYTFKHNGYPYLVCEPTGIGYTVGKPGIPMTRMTRIIDLF